MGNNDDLLVKYYASHRASAIINYNEVTSQGKEIGRVFAEYKDKLVIIDGENKKEHVYLIPKAKVDHYGNNQVYFNIPENAINEFEV